MDYSEIQENEVEALKAIYMDDFEELARQKVWNRDSAPQFIIKLRPTKEYESAIELVIKISMSTTYPKSLPEIIITYSNDLHPKQLYKLKESISTTIKERKNEEMIFDVTSNLQDLLDEFARMSQESSSLDEARIKRLQQEQEQERSEKERKIKEIEEHEQQKKKEFDAMVYDEFHHRETETHQQSPTELVELIPETSDVFTFDRPIVARIANGSTIPFQQVLYGPQTPVTPFGAAYIATPVVRGSSYSESEYSLVITHILLDNMFWETNEGRRQLNELEKELTMYKQFHHPNVLPLYEYQIGRYKKPRCEEGGHQIILLTHWWNMGSLCDLIDTVGVLSMKICKKWSIQLLEGLEALHKFGIVHKCLTASTVVLQKSMETSETTLMICFPSILHKLAVMDQHHPFSTSLPKKISYIETKWQPTEYIDFSQPTRKSDIWQFGIILLQMLCGLEIINTYSSPQRLVKNEKSQWPDSLRLFLIKIFSDSPKKRPTAFELLMDSFTRTGGDLDRTFSLSSTSLLHRPRSYSSNERTGNSGYSRYLNDFDEGVVLGKGGFGQVVKARNKLDGRVYAVKKIQATPKTLSQILQEVVLLSRLDHQYVVRYYTAWLEEQESVEEDLSEIETEATAHSGVTEKNTNATTTATSTATSGGLWEGASASRDASSQMDPSGASTPRFSYSLSELDLFNTSAVSSSSGLIQFGDTDRESDSDEDSLSIFGVQSRNNENDSESEHSIQMVARIPRPVLKSTLYIQMQYCENRTLRDLIKFELYSSPPDYWRLLRQIVEALAYIHSDGIIHRDLKPNNIFIDESNNVKIGDFGLARSVVQPLTSGVGSAVAQDAEDLTTDVGTSLYVAVETLNSQGPGSYNEKIDIYSLGIIWFEMVYPMATDMERINIIRRLRTPSIEVPAPFLARKYELERKLVKELLNHDPRKRPSARQLLTSGDIPSDSKELTIKDALKSILNSKNKSSIEQVCSALFSQPLVSAQQILYDRTIGRKRNKDEDNSNVVGLVKSDVIHILRAVFRVHGAVEENGFRSRIFPRSALYQSNNVSELLDVAGNVLQLPHDLTLPYARRLAERTPPFTKTFTFGTVFRQDPSNIGNHPRVASEVDFDILAVEAGADTQFHDAEAIKVMAEAILAIPFVEREKLNIYVNHCNILSAILDYCGFTPPQHFGALTLLGETGIGPARSNVRRELLARSNISSNSLDVWEKMGFREYVEDGESKLTELLEAPDLQKIMPYLEYIKSVSILVRKFGVTIPICFAPISNYHSKFYECGIMFQIVLEDEGKRSILAAGGRYDSLIKHFTNNILDNRKFTTKAVGFNLALDKVLDYTGTVAGPEKIKEFAVSRPRCYFLVTSFSESSYRGSAIDVARQLWNNGISADIAPPFASSEDLLRYCRGENIPYAVIVKQNHNMTMSSSSFKPLKIKCLGGKVDLDFNVGELIHYAINEVVPDGHKTSAIVSTWEPDVENSTRRDSEQRNMVMNSSIPQEVRRVLVLSENSKSKGRKGRWVLEEKGQEALEQYIGDLGCAPIICLDLKDEILQSICQVSPYNEDEWRRRVASLNPGQKAYIMSVQSKMASEAGRSSILILYSTKTENIFIYQIDQFN